MAFTLTRAELHARVWNSPMRKLAAEFGISDVALHKICRKHDVPTPPAGYWSKIAHGKAARLTPLPRPDESGTILIRPGAGSQETEAMAMARETIGRALADWVPGPGSAPGSSAIIERSIARLERARPGRDGLITIAASGLVRLSMRPAVVERAASMLRLLAEAGEQAGMTLRATGQPAAWEFEGETVSFSLEEAADQVEHVVTAAELRAVERWETERRAHEQRYAYPMTWGRPQIRKWDQCFRGRLAVRLEEVRVRAQHEYWGPIIPRNFADSSTRDLGRMIPRIVATIAAIAVAKRENREADEDRRIAAEEAARRRAEQERRAALERARLAMLDELLAEQARLAQFEACLAALDETVPETRTPRVARLAEWLAGRVALMRRQAGPAALEERLAGARLFEEE